MAVSVYLYLFFVGGYFSYQGTLCVGCYLCIYACIFVFVGWY